MKRSIITRRIVGTLLVVMMLPALMIVPGQSPVMAQAGGEAIVDLHLLPPDKTVDVSETFYITIEARCHGQEINAVDVHLDFDTTYLEVVSIKPGAALGLPMAKVYDNAAGTLRYAAGVALVPPQPNPSDTFVVAVVTFKAKSPTDTTTLISFHHQTPRQTLALINGVSVLRDTFDAIVTVTDVAPPARYVLTVDVDPPASGNVTLAPEQLPDGYEAGTPVTLTAEPAPGWEFERWSGDVTGTESTITLTMDADKSVTAHFTAVVVLPPHFTHTLPAGWNLLSTPIKLDADSDALGQIFDAESLANINVFYTWDAELQRWVQLLDDYELSPLYAIYVKVEAEASATATFILSQELSAPPGRELEEGVNLIGPAPALEAGVFPAMPLDVALVSIEEAPGGLRGYTMVISPPLNQPGWDFALGGEVKDLLPFRGYWVVMENADTLYGFSTTPISP
ncbi:cohesin domain-containing protein [Dehalococcoidia bacterium]|nr:cohesin domain-containing protein [Dehalococcoidia bacterium]